MRKEVLEDNETLGETAWPHLWKDELGDVFILTKRMKIYAYSKTVLGCYCWHKKTYLQLQKTGVIFDVMETDDFGLPQDRTCKFAPAFITGSVQKETSQKGQVGQVKGEVTRS